MENEENILGNEKIGKLIKKFSIPCIISLLVNSLYNILDQIFIGWGVGYLGNGATNVVFPLTMICLAFALMFGDGASAYLSLKLGEKKKEEAAKGVGNGITLSICISILLCVITLVFLPQLLNLFGCTDTLRDYALSYGGIIAIGLPFMMIGTTLNSIIRADGNPKYAMTSMVAGAILNVILDPVFIFVFNMGVEGAAIATVISQIVTFIINILYIKKFKSIILNKDKFKLKGNVARKVSTLGISSFITQMSIVVVIAVENNLLGKYGGQTKFGSEIPITVLGIVMKINQILNSIIIGIASGAQPILGYNYGAGKYDRVKQTLKIVLTSSVIISTIAFILFQTIPDKLISIFGSGDENYMEFACLAFRTYLMLCICNGIQIPSGIFFQAIGKSVKSAILSLSRQILFLIPAMVIFSSLFGINGVLYAGPFADGLAFSIASILLILEIKNLGKARIKSQAINDNTNIHSKLNKHIIITVSREYGSGGRYVGKLIADKLGIKLYDKEFIQKLAEETGLSEEYIENNEQKRDVLASLNNGYYVGLSNSDELFLKESELIKEVANKESCVIIGRCADFILKDRENVIKVFIYSDMEDKIKRATEIYGFDKEKAKKEITRIDKLRANHYKHYTENEWKNPSNYDICINSDTLGVEKSADLICKMVEETDHID
ncbi:MAG: MATE family efflux transporter [Clostridia bacterium]|nr:MATE family efflux transporter [Clostridia bacterium]